MSFSIDLGSLLEINADGLSLSKSNINLYKPKANDRRKYIKFAYGDWFAEHNLKLGRDYFLMFNVPSVYDVGYQATRASITFKQRAPALLFKLRWVGVE